MSATTESTIRTVKSTTTLAEEIDSQTSRARTSTNFGGSLLFLIFFIDDIITFFHPKNQNRASTFKKSLIFWCERSWRVEMVFRGPKSAALGLEILEYINPATKKGKASQAWGTSLAYTIAYSGIAPTESCGSVNIHTSIKFPIDSWSPFWDMRIQLWPSPSGAAFVLVDFIGDCINFLIVSRYVPERSAKEQIYLSFSMSGESRVLSRSFLLRLSSGLEWNISFCYCSTQALRVQPYFPIVAKDDT